MLLGGKGCESYGRGCAPKGSFESEDKGSNTHIHPWRYKVRLVGAEEWVEHENTCLVENARAFLCLMSQSEFHGTQL